MQNPWPLPQDSKYGKRSLPSLCRWLALPVVLWTLLSSANVVDYVATHHALSHGCRELNPFVAALLRIEAFDAVLTTKALFLAMLYVLLPFIHGWKLALLAAATIVYLALCAYQLYGACLIHFL